MGCSHKWDYYKRKAKVAGVRILEVITQGVTMPETVYRVRYDCCGATNELTHEQIALRVSADRKKCASCGQTRWKKYAIGQVVHGYQILKVVRTKGKAMAGTIYQVRALCCKVVSEIDHRKLRRREYAGSKMCNDCADIKRNGSLNAANAMRKQRAEKQSLAKNGPVVISFRPEWPVMSWQIPGEHVVWEDRMW